MAGRSTTELFEHYYTALVYLLPIKDIEFIDELLKHDLLPGDLKIKLESLTIHYERSSYFLDNVIKPQLAVGDHKGFVNLLTIMKNCKYDNAKDLAKRVDEELAVYIKLKYQSKPLVRDLHNIIIPKVVNDWYDLGIQLFSESQLPRLNEIRTNNSNDCRRACVEMLNYWLKITPGATWDILIHALRAPGLQLVAIANDVEEEVKAVLDLPKDQIESSGTGKHSNVTTQLSDNSKKPQPQRALDEPDAYIEEFQDDDVVYAFTCLFNKLRDLFSEVNFMRLKNVCIQRGTLLPATFKQQIRAAAELDDLLEALDNPLYCNWLNIRVLKRIVKAIKIQRAVNLIQAYEEHVYSRKISEVEKYLHSEYFKKSHVSLVSAKIVRSFESLTVADIVKFCEKLEGITGVAGSVTATECQPGCLLITCVIPMQCALHAYLTAKANFLQFRQFHIRYIEIGLFPIVYALKFSDDLYESMSALDSSQVISQYYTCLENYMDADSVSHMMHCKHIITDDDYEAITAAPNDNKMNTLLLQYVRSMNVNQLSKFCDILKSIETHAIIGDCLSTSLLQNLSTSVRVSASKQSMASSIKNMKISEINIIFHDFIDHLCLHLSATEKLSFNLIEICGDIIPLFTERWLKRICHYKSLHLFKVYLLPFVTWLDHSILEQLVVASGSKNALELLNLFDSKIDSYSDQSITSFPILSPSQLMIPLDDSEYTLLAMKFHPPSRGGATQGMIILQDILDMKLILKHNCKICSHGIQLVAMHKKLEIFYWIVPNDLVEVVEESLTHDRKFGIIMVAVKPARFYSLEDNNRKPFSLLSSVWQDDTEILTEESEGNIIKIDEPEFLINTKTKIKRVTNSENISEKQPITSKDTIAISDKGRDLHQDQTDEKKHSSELHIYQLMNIVPLIQEKWSLIGIRLKLSSDELDDIWQAAIEQCIPTESKNTFCCVRMLKNWHERGDDVSADAIIMAVNVPHIGLKTKISSIEAALTSEYVSMDSSPDFTNLPEKLEQPYFDTTTRFCVELSKSQYSISEILVYLKICNVRADVLEEVFDFPELVKSFERNKLLNKADLSWLKNIAHYAQCIKATEAIEEYEHLLLADKISWYSSHPKGIYLVGRTDNKPENVTIKDSSNAKSAISKIVNVKESDSVLDSSEIGSVTFYFKLINKFVSIQIPEVAYSIIEDCRNADLTHVGIMIDDNLNWASIDQIASGARGLFGYSELHVAANSGQADTLKSLLSDDSNISDVNSKTADGGYTPLHLAASAGHVTCVKELLKCHKTDVHVTDTFGRTPLETAERSFKTDVAEFLQRYNYGINSIVINPRSQWEEYICPDCDELMDDPVLTSCGHQMCYKCFDKRSNRNDPCCPVREDDGQEHKMSLYKWNKSGTAEWKINKILVKCKKCQVECTVKRYRNFDCSAAHDKGINSIVINPRSQWEEYICPNCDELINDPILTSCGHQMCYKCFDNKKKNNKYMYSSGPFCPVRDDDGQEHKLSLHDLKWDTTTEWKINKLLVKCKNCDIECTVRRYRKFDCVTAHKGIKVLLISPRSHWDEYICLHCDELMDNPIQTSCGHQMCYKCYDKKRKTGFSDLRCPVQDDNGQEHKMSPHNWNWNSITEQEISKLLVKCMKCEIECTVKRYRKFDCSTAHEGFSSILISPKSQWEEYICPNCNELMSDRVLTSCGHRICYDCFHKCRFSNDPCCPVRDDHHQEHKMSLYDWSKEKNAEWKINKFLVKCRACKVECTVKRYKTFDCSTGHDKGINVILINPRSQWDKYICHDCDELMDDPIQTSCGHQMCYKCFDNRRIHIDRRSRSRESTDDPWCPVRDDDGQEHKMSPLDWKWNGTIEWKINRLLVKCKKCQIECTIKSYRKFDCSTSHEGINLMLINPKSQWVKYICPDCDELMDDPVEASCGHQMCFKCFDKRRSRNYPQCPVRGDDGRGHKIKKNWKWKNITEQKINKLSVKCKLCQVECTVERYRKFDCSSAHKASGIKSILISPRSQWKEYICPYCDDLMNGPVLASCGHRMCYKCFRKIRDLWCPVRDDDGQKHQMWPMSWYYWDKDKTTELGINKLIVKCKKCGVECTVKSYRNSDCSTAHGLRH